MAEYYARAQLANAKMVRQYKTRIEELKRSSFPSISHYLGVLMHTGGKLIGFTSRRLSWAEICLVAMLLQRSAPYARPYLMPLLHAVRVTVIDYLLTVKSSSVASLRAAVAAGLAGLTARITQQSASHTQELVDQQTHHCHADARPQGAARSSSGCHGSCDSCGTSESAVLPVGNTCWLLR